MMVISDRMAAVAGLISPGNVVADVGTDHCYIPIYLAVNKISPRIIAMDVNEGPLAKARKNIAEYGVEDVIETRLSDGLKELKQGEADTIVIAGMGGILINSILKAGEKVARSAGELILSPHKDVHLVRRFLADNGYKIDDEIIVKDMGKFYFVMKVSVGTMSLDDDEISYGVYPARRRDAVMKEYLEKELAKHISIMKKLEAGNDASDRRQQVSMEIETIRRVLCCYESSGDCRTS